jgi:pilus assembly protein FimV
MAVQRDKIIASAEKLVAKGKIEPAIKEYERLLEDNPNDVNTLNRIGDLWVRINRNDEAVKVFGKIADHYARDGFFLKAIAIFKKINKLDPSKLDIYAKLADLYAKQGLAMEAKSQYQVLADYYLKHGDPANALQIYRKISELDPTAINVHVKLADLYSQNNQTGEALKEYDRVGRLLLKRGMLDEAVQVFRKALKIDAKNVELVESLVGALTEAKDFNNAAQIIEAALETNQNNPRLLAMLGKVLVARGDLPGAKTALDRAHAADPNDPSVREGLADIALRRGDADTALAMLTPVVERSLSRGDRNAAVESLNRILRADSGHAPTLDRMVAVYTRLNEETNILASMNSLAEAYIARGNHEEASKVLEKLIAREPQNQQHRNKLQFVKNQSGGVDTLPVRPKAPDLPPMEIEEPIPTFEAAEEPSISLDLDASEPIDLDFSMDSSSSMELSMDEPAPAPQPVAAEPESDDLDFITEHLTEAEVFAKYGLAEKAIEHLRAVIERSPRNTVALERLYKIQLDEGDVDAARTTATHLVSVFEENGDSGAVSGVSNEFNARGHQFGSAAAAPAPAPAKPAPPAAPALDFSAPEEMSFDLDSNEGEFSVGFEEAAAGVPDIELETELPEPSFTAELPEIETELPEFETELPEMETSLPDLAAEQESTLTFDETPDAGMSFGDLADDDTGISFEEPAPIPEPATVAGADELFDFGDDTSVGEPSADEVSELDFYIAQEIYEEARLKVEALLVRFPGNAALTSRSSRIAAAIAQASAASAQKPAALSRDEIESELLSAIPDDDEDIAPPAPIATAPMPAMSASSVQEENLFADEEDFFDLASELEEELAEDEPLSLSEEEQSLEEIFKEFKKGVEQQLDSEDYDTHYNLGIAYKEMGLIDEAIGEFQLASKDPKRSVECSSMLGLCFLEKGMPQLAIKWYRKGLEVAEISEDEHVGLLYDLAAAYQEVGDTENAQKSFMEVYGMNTNYRDVVNRIKQLEDARK